MFLFRANRGRSAVRSPSAFETVLSLEARYFVFMDGDGYWVKYSSIAEARFLSGTVFRLAKTGCMLGSIAESLYSYSFRYYLIF